MGGNLSPAKGPCHWVTRDTHQFPVVRGSVSVVTLTGHVQHAASPTGDSTPYSLPQPTSTAVTQRSAAQIRKLHAFLTLNDFAQFVQLNNGLQMKSTLTRQ
jgi:hypothetical protein